MRVGFAGLGRMGAHMARNLAQAGHEVALWNRTHEKAARLASELSCKLVTTPAALMREAEIVVTMLADDSASEVVYHGPDGLFAGSGATIIVEMGTMSPDHIAKLCKTAPKGVQIIDAPVSGSTLAAEAGTLMIMAGCTAL